MISPIYWHPRLYEAALRLLYLSHYRERIQAVAERIPDGSSVADVCAGDCSLGRYGLRDKPITYTAYDWNPVFVRWARGRGLAMEKLDLWSQEIPSADCVVMMGSLYQFIPRQAEVLEKLIRAARRRVIVNEPVMNLAQSTHPWVRQAAYLLSYAGRHSSRHRFTEGGLRAYLEERGFHSIALIAEGRDLVAVLDKAN
ncbi:MAG: hypothetical protein ACE15F_03530 [bacterium]